MQIAGAHLTYCTNIHPGETWDEVFSNLRTHVLAVRERVAAEREFGIGLRLSARAASTLLEPDRIAELKDFLARERAYVFTINGFPYGPFHGQAVKAAVYRPDWREGERGRYTSELARILAELLPGGMAGSISTVPGGFKRDLQQPEDRERIARQVLESALELHALRERTGREIVLALEPEPCCLLETTGETLEFFERQLLAPEARRFVAERLAPGAAIAPRELAAAEALIRRHVGVCLDTCHAAIEFEEADETLARLAGAGIQISKIQLSAGLRLPEPSLEALRQLEAYDEPVYLHQVVARTTSGALLRFEDLPEALGSSEARRADEWRVHFHVPLYRPDLGAFTNTQAFLARVLERQRAAPVSAQLEVETYTWSVLPEPQRAGGIVASIARELGWVMERLGA